MCSQAVCGASRASRPAPLPLLDDGGQHLTARLAQLKREVLDMQEGTAVALQSKERELAICRSELAQATQLQGPEAVTPRDGNSTDDATPARRIG